MNGSDETLIYFDKQIDIPTTTLYLIGGKQGIWKKKSVARAVCTVKQYLPIREHHHHHRAAYRTAKKKLFFIKQYIFSHLYMSLISARL